MMDEELHDVEILVDLFNERERLYGEATGKIIEKVGPTVLAALYDFFEVGYEAITWVEFRLVESVLLITAVVTYKAGDPTPEMLEKFGPVARPPEGSRLTEIQRLLRVGIPLHIVFKDKERVLEFLNEQIKKQDAVEKPMSTTFVDADTGEQTEVKNEEQENDDAETEEILSAEQFDRTKLSREQIAQLLYHQHVTKGTKH